MPDRQFSLRNIKSLWLHGAGLAGQSWRPVTSDLPGALTPDLPGHGLSPAVLPPRVEAYADALMPMLADGMVLIGHSLGGMVALELAAQSRVRLAALVLVEAVPTVRDRWIGRVGPRLAWPILRHLPRRWLMPMSGAGQSNMAATEIRHWLSRMKRDQIIAAFDAARFYDGRRHLASLDVPTLVVVGSDNSATHRGARLFADTIEDAAFMMLEGGHMLHTDNPQGLRGAIEQFVDERLIGSAVNEKMTR